MDSVLRFLLDHHNNNETSSYDEDPTASATNELDPKVFWPVNGFILLLLISACVMCYKFGGVDWWAGGQVTRRRFDSDAAFQARIRARREAEQERRRGTPEKRRKQLLKSFKRCKVHMIVQEGDLVDSKGDENDISLGGDDASQASSAVIETAVPLGEEDRLSTQPDNAEPTEQKPGMLQEEEHVMNKMETGIADEHEESDTDLKLFPETPVSEPNEIESSPPNSSDSQQHVDNTTPMTKEHPADELGAEETATAGEAPTENNNAKPTEIPTTNLPPTALEMMKVDDNDDDDDSSSLGENNVALVDEESLSKEDEDSGGYASVLDPSDSSKHGYLILRETPEDEFSVRRRVPNCCAICLMCYEVGEHVVWSSNEKCPHAFHMDCLVDWLTKMRDGTPCPCCRAEFTDLEKHRKERRITWRAGNAFNPNVVSFR